MQDFSSEILVIAKLFKKRLELEKVSGVLEMVLSSHRGKKNNDPKTDISGKLGSLKREVQNCQACDLYKTRKNIVFGEGNPTAELVFVGEAPGQEEDLSGRPFVGQAGRLLTRIIEAMGLSREDVYICNVLRCRPPHNRPPRPQEVLSCQGYLKRQLDIIRPKVICCLGRFAAFSILGSNAPLSRLRNRFYNYGEAKVMVTFHPGYLLRNPAAKKLVWSDMKKIRDLLKRCLKKDMPR
jgi:DNA polymerase